MASPLPPRASDVAAVTQWLENLGDRREGSAAESLVFDTLNGWFSGRAGVKRADFSGADGEHSFSQRLWFRVAGLRPGELVVVVPTDGGNHRGVAWAAAWAEAVLTSGTSTSITFLFTGAERGTGDEQGLGSRTFLQDFYPAEPAAVVYLDARASEQVVLTAESGLFPSPLWMVRGLSDALQSQELRFRFTGTSPSLFRLDLPERRNALAPWFDRSIPGLWVVAGPGNARMVAALVGFASALRAIPQAWDRHWLAFDLGVSKVFWDQQTYLVVYGATVFVLLFGYALLSRRRRGSIKVLGQGFWQIPVLLAFGFLALEAGTAVASAIQESRGQSELWKQAPLLVWTFKALVAVTLSICLFLPFRRTPLSRDPDFYGQAALLWLGVMTLAATAFELSFSFYFLWALVWSAVLLVVPWRPAKLVALGLGPLWLFKAAYDVLGPQPDLELSRWVLASPVAGNFVLAVLFFPFLLQVNAWHFSGQRHQHRNEGLRALLQLAAWGLLTLAAGLAVLRLETPPARPVPLVERIDLPSRTRVLPTGEVLPFVDGLWTSKVARSGFLDRTVWSLTFDGTFPAEEVELEVTSQDPLTIFDCSFPVVLDASGHQARIVVGRQPPLPLALRLTLPQSAHAELKVKAVLQSQRRLELTDTVDLKP